MPTWDDLFKDNSNIQNFPQTEVLKFVQRLEKAFNKRPLKIWDLCCGAGRNSISIAKMDHEVYSSDISPTGINYLRKQANEYNLQLNTEICDMTINPWQMNDFNGIFCWDALHHNTIKNIKTTIDIIYNSLVGGGLFMASLVSIHSGRTEKGKQIEPNTYINDQGLESGVPHHYFDEQEIRSLFQSYKILILAEIIANYIETEDRFYENNPFAYTKWNLLLMKEP